MRNREVENFWEDRGQRYQFASTADPNDRSGRKNAYIAMVRDHYILRELADLSAVAKVIDFGCGEGGLTRVLAQAGHDAAGLDITKTLLRLAIEQNHNGTDKPAFIQFNGQSVPLISSSVDAVVIYSVLMYLESELLASVFAELRRVIRPGGKLVVIEQTRRLSRRVAREHKIQHTKREWLAAFAAGGFEVSSSEICRHGHFPFTYLIRYALWPRRWWRFAMLTEHKVGCWLGILPADYADVLFVATPGKDVP